MRTLILDTEMASRRGPAIQLAYLLCEDGRTRAVNHFLTAPALDPASARIHGLSAEFLTAHASDSECVRAQLFRDCAGATLIAHNINADLRALQLQFGPIPHAHGFCTMYGLAKALNLARVHGRPKLPSLAELMAALDVDALAVQEACASFFQESCGAHDARWDVSAVYLCIRQAAERGFCRSFL